MKKRIFPTLATLAIVVIFATALVLTIKVIGQTSMPLGPYGNLGFTNTAQTNTITIPAIQTVGVVTGTPTAAANYTTDTAVNLCALFPFVATMTPGGGANFAWDWYIRNTSAGANTITVLGGAGVTVIGTATAAQNQMRHFKMQLTNCSGTAAVNVYSLETAAF